MQATLYKSLFANIEEENKFRLLNLQEKKKAKHR